MSGKLQSGEVSSTQSHEETEHDMSSTNTEYQADEDPVDLVRPDRSDPMAPITRSQSTKLAEARALPLAPSGSIFSSPAASSSNNAKRCNEDSNEDNHQPIQKRIHQRVDNGPADELQDLYHRIRQERESMDNRFAKISQCIDASSDKMRDLHDQFKQHEEDIDHRFAKLDQKINTLKVQMSKSTERERVAAEKNTDDTIKSKWGTLRYNIRSVVLMLRSYKPKGRKNMLATLRLRIPNASFLNSLKEYSEEIFEGYLEQYIWLFVNKDVFSGHGRQWRGSIFQHFQAMRREAIDSEKDPKKIAELALWFSQAGEAITSQLEQELQQPMADELAKSIFAMFQPYPEPKNQSQILEVLGVIIYDATELVKMFMSSKALLLPVWPNRKGFNRDWSDTDFEDNYLQSDKCNGRYIELRPALVKYGNADGERHDVSVILCKPARLHF